MLKVVEFDSFDEFVESGISGDYEVVTIVKGGSHGKKRVCADLLTDCKRYKTAIRRFFKALEGDSRFDGWKEGIEESCENGYFSDIERYWENGKLVYEGGYHWCVEDYDGRFYIELTVVTGYDEEEKPEEPTETEETKTEKKYEVKNFGSDPFDIACDDCEVHEIEWWEGATAEDLHRIHEEQLEMDASMPDWEIEEIKANGGWEPTPSDFDAWLEQSIRSGYVRVAA